MSGNLRADFGWPVVFAGAWLVGLSAAAISGRLPFWVPAIYAVVSVITFVTYAADKSRAGTGDRRVPERTLHLLALVGGWPGALVAQRYFRHKTLKRRFQVIFWLIVLAHFAAAAWWCYAHLHADAPPWNAQ